jgi:hypothetical protein
MIIRTDDQRKAMFAKMSQFAGKASYYQVPSKMTKLGSRQASDSNLENIRSEIAYNLARLGVDRKKLGEDKFEELFKTTMRSYSDILRSEAQSAYDKLMQEAELADAFEDDNLDVFIKTDPIELNSMDSILDKLREWNIVGKSPIRICD